MTTLTVCTLVCLPSWYQRNMFVSYFINFLIFSFTLRIYDTYDGIYAPTCIYGLSYFILYHFIQIFPCFSEFLMFVIFFNCTIISHYIPDMFVQPFHNWRTPTHTVFSSLLPQKMLPWMFYYVSDLSWWFFFFTLLGSAPCSEITGLKGTKSLATFLS